MADSKNHADHTPEEDAALKKKRFQLIKLEERIAPKGNGGGGGGNTKFCVDTSKQNCWGW